MVLPSEKEGPASRHHRFKGPNSNSNNIEGGGAFPPRRLRPEAMLEMAMALEVGSCVCVCQCIHTLTRAYIELHACATCLCVCV